MAHAARALGLGVMLGCMVESGLGIAAGCVVAPLCDHVDLDGNLLLGSDPVPRRRVHRRGPGARRRARARGGASVSAGEPTLILAEGYSADPHYSKTMRGVLRYRRDDVVAVLDSERAGEEVDGVPIVADVAGRACLRAAVRARRRRDPGRAVPTGVARHPPRLPARRDGDRERPARLSQRRPGARGAGSQTRVSSFEICVGPLPISTARWVRTSASRRIACSPSDRTARSGR